VLQLAAKAAKEAEAAEKAKNAEPKKEKKEKKVKEEEVIEDDNTPPGQKKDMTKNMASSYNPKNVEAAWDLWWENSGYFK
jgi:valyl-tRNA synthetase